MDSSSRPTRKTILIILVVLLLFMALTFIYTRPLVSKMDDHVLGHPADNMLNIYILAWTSHSLQSAPLDLFNATMFYPENDTLTYSDYQLANGLMAWPFQALTGNPIFAHNLVIILSFIIGALGAFLLVDHLARDKLAAVAGGVIFAFAMYKTAAIGQVQSLSTGFIPLSFLCLHLYTERRKPLHVFGFSLFTILTFWSAWIYGFILSFAVLVYLVVLGIMKRRAIADVLRGNVGPERRRSAFRTVVYLVAAFLVVVLVVLPFAIPYLRVQSSHPDFQRSFETVEELSPDFQEFFAAPHLNKAWGGITDGLHTESGAGGQLFLGLMPLILAILGVVYLRRNRHGQNRFVLWFYSTLAVAAAVLCLGMTLSFFGLETGIPMPYRLLYYLFPGFRAVRTPSRMVVLVVLGLSVLGGFGIKWVRERLSNRRHRQTAAIVALIAIAVLFLEMLPGYIQPTRLPRQSEFPKVYSWLGEMEGEASYVTLPLATYDPGTFEEGLEDEVSWVAIEPWRVYFNTANWKRMVNGYSGYIPPAYYDAVRATRDFPSEEAFHFLEGIRVEYVVILKTNYDDGALERLEEIIDTNEHYSVAEIIDDYYVISIR